jgi:hypothetical protein
MPTPLFGVSGAPEAAILQNSLLNSLLAGKMDRAGDHLHCVASHFFRFSPNETTDPSRMCRRGEIGLGNDPIVDHSDGVPHKHKL